MKNIFSRGITSNILKTIAVIAMVIDHIGFYFSDALPNPVYITLRYIGRMAMPIFIYLLVQGFFHTKNLDNYIRRIFSLAVVTQMLLIILMVVNVIYVPQYTSASQVYLTGNILFTFTICLVILKIIHKERLVSKWTYDKNLSLKIMIIFLMIIATVIIPIDYGKEAVILCIFMYFIEKLRLEFLINKNTVSLKGIFFRVMDERKLNIIYLSLLFVAIFMIVIYFKKNIAMLLSIIPISLYNGELGKSNKIVKNMYYLIFPLQHVILYLIAMVTMLT